MKRVNNRAIFCFPRSRIASGTILVMMLHNKANTKPNASSYYFNPNFESSYWYPIWRFDVAPVEY